MNFILEAQVIRVTSYQQLKSIINSSKNVVIKFYADWCQPCKGFAPIYSQISNEPRYSSITFVDVNIQQNSEITNMYGVRSLPTTILVKDQNVVGTVSGAKDAAQFKNILKSYFSL